MKKLFLLLALAWSLPAGAQSMQFNSAPPATALPPGIDWLTRQPVTLFDLGLMELTRQSADALKSLVGVSSAVAEYREDIRFILITFYPATDYSAENCTRFITQLRQILFPEFADPNQLAAHLASLFASYGPQAAGRLPSIGAELLTMTHMVVRLQGGGCEMMLTDAAPKQHAEPGAKPASPLTNPAGKPAVKKL